MRIIKTMLYLAVSCLIISCNGNSKANKSDNNPNDSLLSDFNKEVKILYAQGFAVDNYDGYKKVSIINPDNNKDTLERYILYPLGKKPDSMKISDCTCIPVPIKSMACTSTSIVGMMPLLGLNESIKGIGNDQYVYNEDIRKLIDSGKIKNIAEGMNKNYEQIIMLSPDVLVEDSQSSDPKDKDLSDAGIHIVYMNNWRESNILGRAEWIKLMALLFDKNREADSLFNGIVERYDDVKKAVSMAKDTVNIIWGQDFRGTWYVPGEYTYVTQLLRDAGCKFEYEKGSKSSTPYPLETIFSRHKNDLLWLCQAPANTKDLKDLLSGNEKYEYFDAVKKGRVYSDRKRVGEKGGNDIWESGVYRPDLLLKDVAKISHPDLFKDYELTYWYQLK